MAIFTTSESPAVTVKEIDFSGGTVPNVQSTTGGFVGNFQWGPVDEAIQISDEGSLASTFGQPLDDAATDYLTVSHFLQYSRTAQVVRATDTAAENATAVVNATDPIVNNLTHFQQQQGALDSDGNTWIARYPGELGNSIQVQTCPHSGNNDSAFDNWAYKSYFDGAPGTSAEAAKFGVTNDEMHVVVIDADGKLSGTSGAVLETFGFTSIAADGKRDDGTNINIQDAINNGSEYVYLAGFGTNLFPAKAGTTLSSQTDGTNYTDAAQDDVRSVTLADGANSGTLAASDYTSSMEKLQDKDTVEVDFIVAPKMATQSEQETVAEKANTIANARKDCVALTSPSTEDVENKAAANANAIAFSNLLPSSSYLVVDNNLLKVYDKYHDKYRFIPGAAGVAGLMAATDNNYGAWYSPAGYRRGALLGVANLAYNPSKADRDALYKVGINPIANIPGQGITLFGDKTHFMKPSAFDRINVRRLFLVVERAVERAAQNVLFEFNDEFTRAEFVNVVEPFLREIKGRRGITDFRVVCDETNNTAAVIDRNEFVASLFIKPARSINFITLNFVATRTGVDFDEVVGRV